MRRGAEKARHMIFPGATIVCQMFIMVKRPAWLRPRQLVAGRQVCWPLSAV